MAFRICFLMVVLAFLAGCSTVIEGRSQEIEINTVPDGAKCTLTRTNGDGEIETLGTVSPTPGKIIIRKTKYDMTVTCKEDGYKDTAYTNKSDAAGATVGNVLAGGLIGWAVDSSTGADNKYESPVTITLDKE